MKRDTMTLLQTLLLVWAAGAALTRDGERLHVDAPKGAIEPPLLDALRANKAELLEILPERAGTIHYREHRA